uniref:Putative ovule protein n=1 Tax=Solanum chacoense TaxID=4108 RepID=A0A0V0IQI4_SOLCH
MPSSHKLSSFSIISRTSLTTTYALWPPITSTCFFPSLHNCMVGIFCLDFVTTCIWTHEKVEFTSLNVYQEIQTTTVPLTNQITTILLSERKKQQHFI